MLPMRTINVIPPEDSSEKDSNESSISSEISNEGSVIEKINEGNRKLRRTLFGRLMEFKSNSREFISISNSFYSSPSPQRKVSDDRPEKVQCGTKRQMYKDLNSLLTMYNDLLKANTDLNHAKSELVQNEKESNDLNEKLQKLEISLEMPAKNLPSCECEII